MTIEVALIRHGQVHTNGEPTLTGITDDPLGDEGRQMLAKKIKDETYPETGVVYASNLTRCKETAALIYPSGAPIICDERFNAPNYGDFDGRKLSELKDDAAFMQWQSSKGAAACPNGESLEKFSVRVPVMFKKACKAAETAKRSSVAIVCHRTVINEILLRYYTPRTNYADWNVEPGGGYLLLYNTKTSTIQITGKL